MNYYNTVIGLTLCHLRSFYFRSCYCQHDIGCRSETIGVKYMLPVTQYVTCLVFLVIII